MAQQQFHPLNALAKILNAKGALNGRQQIRAARAETAAGIRPLLHGYRQLAGQLRTERASEATGLQNLGNTLGSNVAGVYKTIADSGQQSLANQNALGKMLNAQSGSIADQSAKSLTGMQSGQLGDYTNALQMRGAPGGGQAQQALASAVASQQQTQAADSAASQQLANSQGGAYGALGAGNLQAGLSQGGSAATEIAKAITSRVGASNQKYDENIQTVLGKMSDVRATAPGIFTQNLLGIRGNEQKYQLGLGAIGTDKAKLAALIAQNKANNAINQKKADASTKGAAASWLNAQTSAWKAHHPNASSTALANQRRQTRQDLRNIKSLIPTGVAAYGAPKTGKQLNQFIGWMNGKTSADPALVRKVVLHWYNNRGKAKPGPYHGAKPGAGG